MKVVWISGSYESVKLNLGKETYYRILLNKMKIPYPEKITDGARKKMT